MAGTLYSTAGKTTVKDEGQRFLVENSAEGPQLIRTRRADVRRALLSVKDMVKVGQYVVFGPDCAFSYKPKTGRVTHFEPTSTGWDHTVTLEPPNEANRIMRELIAAKRAEKNGLHEHAGPGEFPKNLPEIVRNAVGGANPSGFTWPGPRL